jgi:hypothetical protein
MSTCDGKGCKVTSFDVARHAGVSRAAVSGTFTERSRRILTHAQGYPEH